MTSNVMIFENSLEFKPSKEGILSGEEVEQLSKILEIEGRDEDSLRDLRNYLVGKYSAITSYLRATQSKEFWAVNDKSSALVGVIDNQLYKMGYPV